MQCTVIGIYKPNVSRKVYRPLFAWRVPAGFPSPAENYIEGRISLNDSLIDHQLATFFIEVMGDSMEPEITEGDLLVVDTMVDHKNRDIVVARIGDELCVKRLRKLADGRVYLFSDNPVYKPIEITVEMDFEIFGVVLHSIKSFKPSKRASKISRNK